MEGSHSPCCSGRRHWPAASAVRAGGEVERRGAAGGDRDGDKEATGMEMRRRPGLSGGSAARAGRRGGGAAGAGRRGGEAAQLEAAGEDAGRTKNRGGAAGGLEPGGKLE